MQRQTHVIDVKDKILGRLASRIAILLRGKHKPDFFPYKDMGDIVVIKNVRGLKVTGRKMTQKIYYRYSGYPGGLKETSLKRLLKTKPEEVLKKAVYGMLPKNKLREKQIKRLQFQ